MPCNKRIQRAQSRAFHPLEPYRSLPMVFAEVNRVRLRLIERRNGSLTISRVLSRTLEEDEGLSQTM